MTGSFKVVYFGKLGSTGVGRGGRADGSKFRSGSKAVARPDGFENVDDGAGGRRSRKLGDRRRRSGSTSAAFDPGIVRRSVRINKLMTATAVAVLFATPLAVFRRHGGPEALLCDYRALRDNLAVAAVVGDVVAGSVKDLRETARRVVSSYGRPARDVVPSRDGDDRGRPSDRVDVYYARCWRNVSDVTRPGAGYYSYFDEEDEGDEDDDYYHFREDGFYPYYDVADDDGRVGGGRVDVGRDYCRRLDFVNSFVLRRLYCELDVGARFHCALMDLGTFTMFSPTVVLVRHFVF